MGKYLTKRCLGCGSKFRTRKEGEEKCPKCREGAGTPPGGSGEAKGEVLPVTEPVAEPVVAAPVQPVVLPPIRLGPAFAELLWTHGLALLEKPEYGEVLAGAGLSGEHITPEVLGYAKQCFAVRLAKESGLPSPGMGLFWDGRSTVQELETCRLFVWTTVCGGYRVVKRVCVGEKNEYRAEMLYENGQEHWLPVPDGAGLGKMERALVACEKHWAGRGGVARSNRSAVLVGGKEPRPPKKEKAPRKEGVSRNGRALGPIFGLTLAQAVRWMGHRRWDWPRCERVLAHYYGECPRLGTVRAYWSEGKNPNYYKDPGLSQEQIAELEAI